MLHLRAWFVDDATRMNPNLEYAQAIHGRFTGRGTGIIDTIHLVEVARAIEILPLPKRDLEAIKKWFTDYAKWMTTHPYGIAERDTKNNHATCWAMQVAAFAQLTGDEKTLAYVKERFKTVLLPNQEAADGSFPLELARTKPYGYSLFNLEAFSTLAQILDLWNFELPDGRGMRKSRRVYGSVHSRQIDMAVEARRDVLRSVADAAVEPAIRRARISRCRVHRFMEDFARRFDGGRNDPQFLHSPTGAVGEITIPMEPHKATEA